jgi:hypothetical protein
LGGTNLLRSVQDLTEAAALGGPKLKAFADAAGLSADEFKELANADPEGAFNKFIEGLSKMDASEQLQTLRDLGITGTEQISVLQRLASGYGTLEQALGLANDAWTKGGDALAEATKKAGTTQGAINELKNQFNDLLVSIGDKLTGKLGQVATGLTPIVSSIKDWVDANPELVTAIAGATLVLGGLALAVGAAGIVIGAATTAFTGLAAAVGLVNIPMLLLAGAVGLLVFTWNTLGQGLVDSWRDAFEQIGIFIQNVIDKVSDLIGKIGEAVRAIPGLQPSSSDSNRAGFEALLDEHGGFDGADGNHATGLRTVPNDGYRAILHKGEAVLKRGDADAWRQGGGGSGSGVTINVYPSNLMGSRQEVVEWFREAAAEAGL